MMRVVLLLIVAVIFLIAGFGCLSLPRSSSLVPPSHWRVITEAPGTDLPWYSPLTFFDENNGIAVSGTILRTTADGGRTWSDVYNFNDKSLTSMTFEGTSKTLGFVVGARWKSKNGKDKPIVLRTDDRGLHWVELSFDANNSNRLHDRFSVFNDICFENDSTAWVVGDGGIVQTRLLDNSVRILNIIDTEAEINSVSCDPVGGVWVAGRGGIIGHYDRSRWNFHDLGKDRTFTKVLVASGDIWVVGSSIREKPDTKMMEPQGVLLRSNSNGKVWNDMSPPLSDGLVGIAFDGQNGWAIGLGGAIYSSVDRGSSWTRSHSPTGNTLAEIVCLDSDNIWIAGDGGIILKHEN
jgi:photosystem II stability/assembly factor-like uncharacterized protein